MEIPACISELSTIFIILRRFCELAVISRQFSVKKLLKAGKRDTYDVVIVLPYLFIIVYDNAVVAVMFFNKVF